MPKTFREAPFIGADDGVGIPILKARFNSSLEKVIELCTRFDDNFILQVAAEVGLDECCTYDKDGKLEFDFTPLQLVSMMSALAACAEFRRERPNAPTKQGALWDCYQCGHQWRTPRASIGAPPPRRCPECKSPDYATKPKAKSRRGS